MKMPFGKIALGTLSALALVTATPEESAAGPRYGWHGHSGSWAGPAVAAGIIGGLALGALAASSYSYGPAGCAWRRQPAYDAWGQFIGYRAVQVCY